MGELQKHRFFIYEEYSAVFDKVKKDVEMADRVVPGWSANQKGLEVLGSSVFYPPERGGDRSRRALAIKDLVVKVCYPLVVVKVPNLADLNSPCNGHANTISCLRTCRDTPPSSIAQRRTWRLRKQSPNFSTLPRRSTRPRIAPEPGPLRTNLA
jgi:hypothetical protein